MANQDYHLPQILEIICENVRKYGNPLGLNSSEIAGWAKGLHIPENGDVLFYTGGEYQLVPYIDTLVQTMSRLDTSGKSFQLMLGVRNIFDRAGINAEKMFASVLAKERDRFMKISAMAAAVLSELGLKYCYLGEKELYSGALLYEFGFQNDFVTHARKLASLIQKTGASTVICLSPHSAEVLQNVYPKVVPGFSVKTLTFVQAINQMLQQRQGNLNFNYHGSVTIHDSCRLAREMGVVEEIREVLMKIPGLTIVEPARMGKWTSCCGGPSKALFPELAGMIANRRVDELAATGAELALTFCPYCLAAMGRSGKSAASQIQMEDIIEFMYRGVVA